MHVTYSTNVLSRAFLVVVLSQKLFTQLDVLVFGLLG